MTRRRSSIRANVTRWWEVEVWREDLAGRRVPARLGIQALRILAVVAVAFQDRLLNLHAMGLVYSTLLSLVPFIAVAVSVLKAFGVQYTVEPLLSRVLAPMGQQGAELAHTIVEFVSRMNVKVLGAVGLAALFYTVLSLIGRVEDALNDVWHVRRARGLRRKFSDYLSVLLVGPVLVFGAFAILAAVRSTKIVERLLVTTRAEAVAIFLAGHLTPFVLLTGGFTFIYAVLPNTKVRVRSAVTGAVTAAVLWELAGVAFAALVAGSTSYAAIYSSFAVVIVSLIWLQLAWLIILIGARVAHLQQSPSWYVAARRRHGVLFRERIGLAALAEVTRRYLAGEPASPVDHLAGVTGAPTAAVNELADVFVARGILVRAAEPDGVVLARPPEDITVLEALDAIHDPSGADSRMLLESPNAVSEVLRRRDEALRQALGALTLRSLTIEPRSPAAVADFAQYRR